MTTLVTAIIDSVFYLRLLLDDRYGNHSKLVNAKMTVDKWHALIGDPNVGDAPLERLPPLWVS